MLTLTDHLWGEESAFPHLHILCMPRLLSYAALAVFSELCDLHSAQAYVDPYSSAGVIFTDLLQQP